MTIPSAGTEQGGLADRILPNRPQQIRAEHLLKLAVVYLRQSSADQVKHHTGSTESQRDLASLPLQWGWDPSRVKVVDDDLGLSGTSSHRRTGFQGVLKLIDRGAVGLFVARDVSRVSRDPSDAEMFLKKAIRAGVLLYVSGQMFDVATEDLCNLFGLRIQSLLAWMDNAQRSRLFRLSKLSRIERGYAVSRPTIGYVETTRGKWIMDPDQNVRTSIDLIFDLYLRFKSTRRVEKYFNEHGLRFPRRRRGELVWLPLSGLDVIRILKNPGYTGDYVFGRLREVEAGDPPRKHFEQRPRSEWAVYPNHHAAYVTRERWERIQMMLAERRPSVRPPLGKGAALLQGLVRCARCDRWMRTVYSDRRGADRIPRYLCHPVDYMRVARHHLSCSALLLDRTVTNIVLSAISPPNIDSALDALKSAALESEALQQVHHRHLRRLEDEVADARRQHALADPNSRLVRADLEARFEEALRRRDEFRQQLTLLAAPPATSIGPDAAKELVTLAADVRRLWQAPSTTNEDRKQLLRTALSQILVVASTEQYLDIELVWAGGRREPHRIPRPKAVDQLVRDLHGEGLRPSEILDRLLSKDVPNRSGKPLTEQAIRMKLYSLGLNQKTDRLRDLILIRQLLCDGRTRREILDILKEHTSEPIRGKWTAAKLSDAIRSLRLGLYRGDIEPLPSDLVSNSRWPIPAAAVALIRHGREHGASWESIAEKLNTSGFKPPRSARFSPVQTRELFKRLMVQYGVDPPGPSAYSTASNESVCVHLRAWSPSQTATEMASKLNALGLRTKFGRGWTPQAVGLKCRTLGLSARRNEPHQTTILDSPPNLPGDR